MTTTGERYSSACGLSDSGESAKYFSVLTELKNRGVYYYCIVVCDELRSLPEAITTT